MTGSDWLALASLIVATIYSVLTYGIMRANKAVVHSMQMQQEGLNRPYIEVAVSIRTGTQLFYLIIKNVGRSSAINLRLTLDRPVHSLGRPSADSNLQVYSAFSKPIDSMPPATELRFLVGMGPTFFAPDADEKLSPRTFVVKAEYEFADKTFTENTPVDLRPFLNSDVPHNPVVEELQKLREAIQKLPREVAQEIARNS